LIHCRSVNGNTKGLSPKLAVVMIGTNNANEKQNPEDVAADVKAIVEKLRTELPETIEPTIAKLMGEQYLLLDFHPHYGDRIGREFVAKILAGILDL
jgi:hypothetical protein